MSASDAARMTILFAVLVMGPIPLLYKRIPLFRMIGYSLVYTAGLVCWSELLKFLQRDVGLVIPLLNRLGLAVITPFTSNLVVGGLGGCWLAWALCRWRYGRVIEQDGTLCPNCAYSLVGCSDRVCPECGREFTLQELGTTEQALLKVRDGTVSREQGGAWSDTCRR